MKHLIRSLVPSMFHRRLILLVLMALGVSSALAMQMSRLTLSQGDLWRSRAEVALVRSRPIPTVRGRILDRHGRILAEDRPTYDVAVAFSVISDRWAFSRAGIAAWNANRQRWNEADFDTREQLRMAHRAPYDQQVRDLWRKLGELGNVNAEELERRRSTVVSRVQQIASDWWLWQLTSRSDKADEPLELRDVAEPISEEYAPHAILTDVDDQALSVVRRLINDAREQYKQDRIDTVWRHVSIVASRRRDYPLTVMHPVIDRSSFPGPLAGLRPREMEIEGVGVHLIGLMREVWRKDVDDRPYRKTNVEGRVVIDSAGYLPGDQTGSFGIERALEDSLRGRRGQWVERLDTSQRQDIEPVPGKDVALSIDIFLQARIQALMDPRMGLTEVQPWHHRTPPEPLEPQIGEPLNGAAVVMDVSTGQVLAAVSTPAMPLERLREQPETIWGDALNTPYVNRAVTVPYQPGSTVKPLVLAGAITDQRVGADEGIECHGHLEPNSPGMLQCWIFKQYHTTHQTVAQHALAGPEAIARSCNIYFFTMGRRLGAKRLVWWFDRFGLGRATGSEFTAEESGGFLPDLRQADQPAARGFSRDDATQMGIGQGPVAWTPIQAAAAYAALARGGYWITPTFLKNADQLSRPQQRVDLGLDPRGVEAAMAGLRDAVNEEHGTGHHIRIASGQKENIFDLLGVTIYGKSGTADAAPLRIDSDKDRRITTKDQIVRKGDHAWFITLVQRAGSDRPNYVVVTVMEFGGSGGVVSGPLTNQILHAMRAEGYL